MLIADTAHRPLPLPRQLIKAENHQNCNTATADKNVTKTAKTTATEDNNIEAITAVKPIPAPRNINGRQKPSLLPKPKLKNDWNNHQQCCPKAENKLNSGNNKKDICTDENENIANPEVLTTVIPIEKLATDKAKCSLKCSTAAANITENCAPSTSKLNCLTENNTTVATTVSSAIAQPPSVIPIIVNHDDKICDSSSMASAKTTSVVQQQSVVSTNDDHNSGTVDNASDSKVLSCLEQQQKCSSSETGHYLRLTRRPKVTVTECSTEIDNDKVNVIVVVVVVQLK